MMKKIILIIVLALSSIIANAQVYSYKATHFSYYCGNREWSSWEPSNAKIKINFFNDTVILSASETQVFTNLKHWDKYKWDDGNETISFMCIDQDSHRVKISLTRAPDGTTHQIDFILSYNKHWTYKVKRYE